MATEAKVFGESGTLRMSFPTGTVVAALLAAMIGLLVIGAVNIYSNVDAGFRAAITLNAGIGPYSGKEVFWLAGWFLSWVILHLALRKKEVSLRRWFAGFMVGMLVATLLVWPPIFEAIANVL